MHRECQSPAALSYIFIYEPLKKPNTNKTPANVGAAHISSGAVVPVLLILSAGRVCWGWMGMGWDVRAGNACGGGSWAGLECPLLAAAHLTLREGPGSSQPGLSLRFPSIMDRGQLHWFCLQICFLKPCGGVDVWCPWQSKPR